MRLDRFCSLARLVESGVSTALRAPKPLTRAAWLNPMARHYYFTPSQVRLSAVRRSMQAVGRLELAYEGRSLRGAGFLVSPHGHLATAAHAVVEPVTNRTLPLHGRLTYRGRQLPLEGVRLLYRPDAVGMFADLAILLVPDLVGEPYVQIREALPPPGLLGALLGFPLGGQMKVTIGPVLRRELFDQSHQVVEIDVNSRAYTVLPVHDREELATLVARIRSSPGSSGGPLVDRHGRLLGMASMGPVTSSEAPLSLKPLDHEAVFVPASVIRARLAALGIEI